LTFISQIIAGTSNIPPKESGDPQVLLGTWWCGPIPRASSPHLCLCVMTFWAYVLPAGRKVQEWGCVFLMEWLLQLCAWTLLHLHINSWWQLLIVGPRRHLSIVIVTVWVLTPTLALSAIQPSACQLSLRVSTSVSVKWVQTLCLPQSAVWVINNWICKQSQYRVGGKWMLAIASPILFMRK
jgi:hypothetical protein